MSAEPLEDEGILHFIREYTPCAECQGWDERMVGIQPPRRDMSGRIIDAEPRPSGITLKGRSNHRRICKRGTP